MTNNIYTETGNYSHTIYTIRESKKGFIIEVNSDLNNDFNGSKILIKFSEQFPKGLDLNSKGSELIILRHDLGTTLKKGKN